MRNLRRLAVALSSALTVGVGAVLVLSATAPGAQVLRAVANNLAVTAHADGGGISIGTSPTATLTAKLAASVSVSYTCQPVIDSFGNIYYSFSSFLSVGLLEKEGKVIARGSGFTNGTAVCDDIWFNRNPTVNHATIVVIPDYGSPAFKHGAALVSVNANACPNNVPVVTSPPFFPPCDFGNLAPTAISIK
jgi:hypothetical protein